MPFTSAALVRYTDGRSRFVKLMVGIRELWTGIKGGRCPGGRSILLVYMLGMSVSWTEERLDVKKRRTPLRFDGHTQATPEIDIEQL